VFDHVEIPVSDLATSVAFHSLVLERLGIRETSSSSEARSPETRSGWNRLGLGVVGDGR
jgi:hypothetical protein